MNLNMERKIRELDNESSKEEGGFTKMDLDQLLNKTPQ